MSKRALREQARELRRQGMAVGHIAEQLAVAKSSVSLWVRDIELTPAQVETLRYRQPHYGAQNKGASVNRENGRKRRLEYQQAGRSRAQQGSPLHRMACMLYWAEGAKSRNSVVFTNSDADMSLLFLRFLRQELLIEPDKIKIKIICHKLEDVPRIEHYWLSLFNLPPSSLNKTYIKKGSDYSRNTLPNGVCQIWVNSSEVLHHIYGAIQEYGGFDRPEWLF